MQAYTGVSDDEVIEATLMDQRWQLVLDCLYKELHIGQAYLSSHLVRERSDDLEVYCKA